MHNVQGIDPAHLQRVPHQVFLTPSQLDSHLQDITNRIRGAVSYSTGDDPNDDELPKLQDIEKLKQLKIQQAQQLTRQDLSKLTEQEKKIVKAKATIQVIAQLQLALKEARESPLGLYKLIFADPRGQPVVIKWFHEEWNEMVTKHKHVQIESPRGSTKTSFMLAAALWIIGKRPNIRIKWLGPNDSNVQKRLQFIRSVILESKLYQLAFPNVRQAKDKRFPNNANFLTLERDQFMPEPTIEAKGVTSTGAGDRADLIIMDDVCLAAGTAVLTWDGVRPIEDIKPGDRVRNHKGGWSTVGKVHKNKVQHVTRIHAQGMLNEIVASAAHPLLTCASNTKMLEGREYSAPDFRAAHSLTEEPPHKASRDYLVIDPEPAQELTRADLAELWPEDTTQALRGQHVAASRAGFPVPTTDPNFWWLVGLWLAEGTTALSKAGTGMGYHVSFGLHEKETRILTRLRKICKRLLNRSLSANRVKSRANPNRHGISAILSDKALHTFLQGFYLDPHGAENRGGFKSRRKECPGWIYDLPKEHLQQLLTGYWEGDGYLGAKDTYRISSVSLTMLQQLQFLSGRFGICASISKLKQSPLGKRPIYSLYLGKHFGQLLPKGHPQRVEPSSPTTYGVYHNKKILRPIRSAETIKKETYVYNLSMCEGEHSYQSPDFTSHNCTEKNAILEPSTREKIKHTVLNDWLPILDSLHGQIWCIFTPWSDEDVNAYLKKKAKWTYKHYHHGKPGDITFSMFPELWPRHLLKERLRWLGRIHYARAYLCQSIASDVVAVRPQDLVPYSHEHLTSEDLANPNTVVILSIDPSAGKNLQKGADADHSGFAILIFVPTAADPDTGELPPDKPPFRIFVVDAYGCILSTRNQVLHIAQLCQAWKPHYILGEDEGTETLASWLEEYQAQNPTHITADIQRIKVHNRGKATRLLSITPLLEAGDRTLPTDSQTPRITYFHPNVIDPQGAERSDFYIELPDGLSYEAHRTFRHEALNFPTRHEDVLDSVVQGLSWLRTWFIPMYTPEIQAKPQVSTGFVPYSN